MIPGKTIEELINKHSMLEKDLSSGKIDKKLFAEKSKEYSDLNEIIGNAKDYISFQNEKEELEKILNDSSGDEELKKMAEIELIELQKQHEINEKKLKYFSSFISLFVGPIILNSHGSRFATDVKTRKTRKRQRRSADHTSTPWCHTRDAGAALTYGTTHAGARTCRRRQGCRGTQNGARGLGSRRCVP